jgi:hypothetical protein
MVIAFNRETLQVMCQPMGVSTFLPASQLVLEKFKNAYQILKNAYQILMNRSKKER